MELYKCTLHIGTVFLQPEPAWNLRCNSSFSLGSKWRPLKSLFLIVLATTYSSLDNQKTCTTAARVTPAKRCRPHFFPQCPLLTITIFGSYPSLSVLALQSYHPVPSIMKAKIHILLPSPSATGNIAKSNMPLSKVEELQENTAGEAGDIPPLIKLFIQ